MRKILIQLNRIAINIFDKNVKNRYDTFLLYTYTIHRNHFFLFNLNQVNLKTYSLQWIKQKQAPQQMHMKVLAIAISIFRKTKFPIFSANTTGTIHFCHQFKSTIDQKKRKKLIIGYLSFCTGFVVTKVNTLTQTWIKFVTAFVWRTQIPIALLNVHKNLFC